MLYCNHSPTLFIIGRRDIVCNYLIQAFKGEERSGGRGCSGAGVKALIRAINGGACADLGCFSFECEGIDAEVAASLVGAFAAGSCPKLHYLGLTASISKEAKAVMRATMKGAGRDVTID